MREHTNARLACQPDTPATLGNTPRQTDPATSTLARRYGTPAATAEGWASIPNIVLRTRRQLGVTGPLWELCEAIWFDWRGEEPPHIALVTLAERLGVHERTIERYTATLESLHVLHVDRRMWTRGQRQLNAYDLRPMIAAALAHARPNTDTTGGAVEEGNPETTPDRATGQWPSQTTAGCQLSKNAFQEQQKNDGTSTRARATVPPTMCSQSFQHSTINAAARGGEKTKPLGKRAFAEMDEAAVTPPPKVLPPDLPTTPAAFFPPVGGSVDRSVEWAVCDGPAPAGEPVMQLPLDPDDQALVAPIQALIYELGDDAPASSITRAQNLRRDVGQPADQFLRVLDDATARTRAHRDAILKRRRDGQTRNGMPYLFAVLQDLLAPPRARRLVSQRNDRRQSYEEARRVTQRASYAPYPESPPATMWPAWRDTLDELRHGMLRDSYERQLLPTCVLTHEGDLLRIGVVDSFQQFWLDKRMRGKIERVMARTAPGVRVEFVTQDGGTAVVP